MAAQTREVTKISALSTDPRHEHRRAAKCFQNGVQSARASRSEYGATNFRVCSFIPSAYIARNGNRNLLAVARRCSLQHQAIGIGRRDDYEDCTADQVRSRKDGV